MKRIELLKKQGDALFDNRGTLMSLWQEIADNFYPERADFTVTRELGEEFAENLDTSYPLLARRDLGNQIGGMLRPTNKEWFSIIKRYEENLDTAGQQWLEWAAKIQKRAMYDPVAMFTRATKEADHDWAAFGQAVLSVRMNYRENALLHRCWHLRDVAWKEDSIGRIGTVYRKWKPDALTLTQIFGDKTANGFRNTPGLRGVHRKVAECVKKDPYKEFNIYHCEVPAETYGCDEDTDWGDKPLVSIYYDVDNNHIMEEVAVYEGEYVIPRWQTVSGSQYAFSPAATAALPDARLLQAVASVLLDASEKIVDPPMIAVQEAVRSDVSIYAGGITWVDADYDERLGEVLREMRQGGNLPVGFEMQADTREMIAEAFFLNKLALPPPVPGMTAYEASERVAEYIRQALPLFEPMEAEYDGALCEKDFNILMANGAFGSPQSMPESLYGGDISFQFESPMREAVERVKGQRFVETKDLIAAAMELDPSTGYVVDAAAAVRDALEGIGSPAKWRRSKEEVVEMQARDAQAAQLQQMLEMAQQGADVAKTAGEAAPMEGLV
jgi:hypothetical protein